LNGGIEDRGNRSPDFAMTERKIYIWINFVLSTAKLLQMKEQKIYLLTNFVLPTAKLL